MIKIEDIELWHGDCLELMSDIPDNTIDLTVTSPPYDDLRTYNENINQWSFAKFQEIAKELYRITKNGGTIVWIVNDATINGTETGTSFKQALWFKEIGFNLHDTMIWEKPTFTAVGALKTKYAQVFEYMFIFTKGKIKTFNPIKDRKNKYVGTIGGNHRGGLCTRGEYGARFNIWKYDNGKYNTTKDLIAFHHPAVFPEQLANDHIISWSNPNEIVFDPFMGSGTTAKMAMLNNRRFIGCEISEEYCNIIKDRLNNVQYS